MCGIAGLYRPAADLPADSLEPLAWRMAASLRHRGPDAGGVWADAAAGLALAHRRLAIVDLSAAANQPMLSSGGRWMLVYNGEIYNFRELRTELDASGHRFRGQSDTEVLLAAVETWGLAQALRRSVGMFALALWDRQERVLYLARDRMGEKPLYYGWVDGTFLFGSELKALKAYRGWQPEIDLASLALLFRHNFIPTPLSIYKGVSKLEPGTILRVSASSHPSMTVSRYWSLRETVTRRAEYPAGVTASTAGEDLDKLLREAVRGQMIADVPVGAFLSGGVDSSTIVALMQAQSRCPVRTFTLGFEALAYDETKYARAIARHLGTQHTEIILTAQDALSVIPRLPALYDEPFSDSSQIATHVVASLARQRVKVILSGDGADELFGGYDRYVRAHSLWRQCAQWPSALRSVIAYGITRRGSTSWDRALALLRRCFPSRIPPQWSGDRMHKAAALLRAHNLEELYRGLISHWDRAPIVQEPAAGGADSGGGIPGLGDIESMMLLDSLTYLPDDILVKLDRASMGVGLEARAPFLDHRVVEFAWRLPPHLKVNNMEGKRLLREVLDRYVPRALVERPKMGFGVPIDAWLRGPLRDWAEALLDSRRLHAEGYLDPQPIRQKWREHLGGARNWQYHLWDVLMVQAWLEQERSSRAVTETPLPTKNGLLAYPRTPLTA